MGGFGGKEEVNPGSVRGTKLRILEYPHPLLREANADVVDFDYKVGSLRLWALLVVVLALHSRSAAWSHECPREVTFARAPPVGNAA